MRRCRRLAVAAWLAAAMAAAPADQPIRVMVVTGGHEHPPSFYTLFDGDPAIQASVNPHPTAFSRDFRDGCDVLALYDLVQSLDEKQRNHLRDFVESGKGVVVIHHALADYNDWEWWWREVVGGRYLLKPGGGMRASSYKRGVAQNHTVAARHPVTRGLVEMRLVDETFKDLWISPDAQVLLRSDAPSSDGPAAWISAYPKSRVVYIQPGHGEDAHRSAPYRRMVRNALLWAAGRVTATGGSGWKHTIAGGDLDGEQ